ncbi:SET domain-containing protein [Schizophyllum commune H4-8]|nr:SET domain-containing protein [Schizophyllum commune H4-8]KAI5894541.1 SET domain-containing protein [Schizophyllum commune H4-8]
MKRGFLNSKKGKAAIASDASSAASAPDKKPDGKPGEGQGGEASTARPVNAREDLILVPGASLSEMKESPGDFLEYDAKTFVITTIPARDKDTSVRTPTERSDGWAEAIIDGDTKRAIFSQRAFPASVSHPSSAGHCVEPTNGAKGVFATRRLKQGELILAERPLVMVPRAMVSGDEILATSMIPGSAERAAWLDVLVQRMLPDRREVLLRLTHAPAGDKLSAIDLIRANGLTVNGYTLPETEGADGRYVAVYETLSRANHSCRPNAHFAFHKPSFSVRLRALRDIKAGEEILISYVPPEAPYAQRQEELAHYGLSCACGVCDEGPSADERRARLAASLVEDSTRSKKQEFDRISQQIALFEREGLAGLDVYMNNILYGLRLAAGVGEWEKCGVYNEKMTAIMPLYADEMGEEQAEQLSFLGL